MQRAYHVPHGLPPQVGRPLVRCGDLRIAGRGGAHHQEQWDHPGADRGHLVGEDANLPPRIRLGPQGRHPLAVKEHHIAVVSCYRPADHLNKQICFAADCRVNRLHGDPGRARHLRDSGCGIALLQETLPGGGRYPPPGLKPLPLRQPPAFSRVIGAGTGTTVCNSCHNKILARMPLSPDWPDRRRLSLLLDEEA